MLADTGGTVSDRKGPEKGGAVRCWASPGYGAGWSYIQKVNKVSVSVLDNWGNAPDLVGGRNFSRTIPFDKLKAIMTAAEVQAARDNGSLNELPSKIGFYLGAPIETRDEAARRTHREAVAASGTPCDCGDHAKPNPVEEITQGRTIWNSDGTDGPVLICAPPEPEPKPAKPDRKAFEQMAESLKAGVKVVTAPQLFPTPPETAEYMVDLADIQGGNRVLEPSAGSGNIIAAIRKAGFNGNIHLDAIEINYDLCQSLKARGVDVDRQDFLEVEPGGTYCPDAPDGWDRIIMNPPFQNGADIKHIKHALSLLKPGGKLVALCAGGPRQKEQLEPLADYWEPLPEGSFKAQGTNVSVCLMVAHKPLEGSLF
jgi:SAM-dependent methyltransferase